MSCGFVILKLISLFLFLLFSSCSVQCLWWLSYPNLFFCVLLQLLCLRAYILTSDIGVVLFFFLLARAVVRARACPSIFLCVDCAKRMCAHVRVCLLCAKRLRSNSTLHYRIRTSKQSWTIYQKRITVLVVSARAIRGGQLQQVR